MSAYDRTHGTFMDADDIMEFTGRGKTFAGYTLHSIGEVCGTYHFGTRCPMIAYEDYQWWIRAMGGLKMDWSRQCLEGIDTAKRQWEARDTHPANNWVRRPDEYQLDN
ncbi:MAG: hypothetical protein HFJ68_04935 [Adlercreutzia caecimuris]|uniref:hypothetical protein n=1 Tax=Adlercreutzia caecimuris TaxID=671266 RepID=UPI00242C5B53|nr:hypothetical protein [Adlercreutzia caecimuris]MCI9207883.1 hypothetical protein [Adlercreutzia caecimuris]